MVVKIILLATLGIVVCAGLFILLLSFLRHRRLFAALDSLGRSLQNNEEYVKGLTKQLKNLLGIKKNDVETCANAIYARNKKLTNDITAIYVNRKVAKLAELDEMVNECISDCVLLLQQAKASTTKSKQQKDKSDQTDEALEQDSSTQAAKDSQDHESDEVKKETDAAPAAEPESDTQEVKEDNSEEADAKEPEAKAKKPKANEDDKTLDADPENDKKKNKGNY